MKTKFEFTLTGFIIAGIMISMVSVGFALFLSDMEDTYNVDSNTTLSKYNLTKDIREDAEDIRDSTDIQQKSGILDVIGGFFSSGYSALKLTGKSIDMFVGNEGIIDQASEDVEVLAYFKDNLISILLIGIFVGVFIGALVKWKV